MKDSRANRWIDRWVGQALCWLVRLVPSSARGAEDPRRPKILLIEIFEMGAAVMLVPTLQYLRRVAPDAEVSCLTAKSSAAVWRATGAFQNERLFMIDTSGLWSLARTSWRAIWRLRREGFDVVIDCELFMRLSAVFAGLVRGRRTVGFYRYGYEGLGRGRIHDLPCAFNQNQHIARNFLALAKTAIERRADVPNYKDAIPRVELELPRYVATEATRAAVTAKLVARCPEAAGRRLVVLSHSVGSILAVRNYPRYAEVVQRILAARDDVVVCLVGTAADRDAGREVCARVASSRCVELCGETTFDELLALLTTAALVVANDNGIAHFGAWARVPTLALFSTDSPFVYGPLGPCKILYAHFACSPCISALNHKSTPCTNNRCLQALPPEHVAEHALAALGGELQAHTINGTMPYLF